MFGTLVFALLVLKSTLQHYVPPPNACLLSKICNHTWTPGCGQESVQKDMRMFLDLCDMFEYNCDKKTDYIQVDIKECPKGETTTDKSTTVTTTLKPTTAECKVKAVTIDPTTTKPATREPTAKPENVTTMSTKTTAWSATASSYAFSWQARNNIECLRLQALHSSNCRMDAYRLPPTHLVPLCLKLVR